MASLEIINLYYTIQSLEAPSLTPVRLHNTAQTRPNSLCVEDTTFGDSGKGSVVAKLNELHAQRGPVYSLRYNGGANAGHETYVHGRPIVTHQLPTGVITENVTAIIGRSMVLHPEDLLTEINRVAANFGGELPGRLLIDSKVVLALDTHRAEERAHNFYTTGGQGSTGRGIAQAYASFYERHPVLLEDLLSEDWEEKLRQHYQFYAKKLAGFDVDLKDIPVYRMGQEKGSTVGSLPEFLGRLSYCRDRLRKYAEPQMYDLLLNVWQNPNIPFTFEGAQGPGLDPYHGVYPDVTASRPMSHNINDATYGIIRPEELAQRMAVMKTTYMSSVGKRVLPTFKNEDQEKWIQETFDEKGRSTGRLRDIYPITLPILAYLKRASGYDSLVATHVDASRPGETIRVITHYTDKITGQKRPYLPYQNELDKLQAHIVEFPGWDGEAAKRATLLDRLPEETRRYLLFLEKTVAPIAMLTTGPDLDQYLLNGL